LVKNMHFESLNACNLLKNRLFRQTPSMYQSPETSKKKIRIKHLQYVDGQKEKRDYKKFEKTDISELIFKVKKKNVRKKIDK